MVGVLGVFIVDGFKKSKLMDEMMEGKKQCKEG